MGLNSSKVTPDDVDDDDHWSGKSRELEYEEPLPPLELEKDDRWWRDHDGEDLERMLCCFAYDGTEPPRSAIHLDKRVLAAGDEHHCLPNAGRLAPIRLIDARYIESLPPNAKMCRRQDLPEEAFLSLDALKRLGPGSEAAGSCLRIIAVSHPWQSKHEPDPNALNFRLLRKVLKVFRAKENSTKTFGIFVDFMSLYQRGPKGEERTDLEEEIYQKAIGEYDGEWAAMLRGAGKEPSLLALGPLLSASISVEEARAPFKEDKAHLEDPRKSLLAKLEKCGVKRLKDRQELVDRFDLLESFSRATSNNFRQYISNNALVKDALSHFKKSSERTLLAKLEAPGAKKLTDKQEITDRLAKLGTKRLDALNEAREAKTRTLQAKRFNMMDLYAHPHVYTFLVTKVGYPKGFEFLKGGKPKSKSDKVEYEDRGWCFCESLVSGMVGGSDQVLDLAKFDEKKMKQLEDVEDGCKAIRKPPLTPANFNAALAKKTFSDRSVDRKRVQRMYRATFEKQIGSAKELTYYGLKWTDKDVFELGKVVDLGVLADRSDGKPGLEALFLGINKIGDDGVRALMEAAASADGLQWRQVDEETALNLDGGEFKGVEVTNDALGKLLQKGQLSFTREDIDAFKKMEAERVTDLEMDDEKQFTYQELKRVGVNNNLRCYHYIKASRPLLSRGEEKHVLSATGKGVQGRVEVGVQYFQPIEKGALAQLKELHLGFNEISDIGVGHITKAVKNGWLPQIEDIDLKGNMTVDKGLGLKWKSIGPGEPSKGRDLSRSLSREERRAAGKLSRALMNGQHEFSVTGLAAFKLPTLCKTDYVKVGSNYFTPMEREGKTPISREAIRELRMALRDMEREYKLEMDAVDPTRLPQVKERQDKWREATALKIAELKERQQAGSLRKGVAEKELGKLRM